MLHPGIIGGQWIAQGMEIPMTNFAPSAMKYRDSATGFPKGWYCVAESGQVPANSIFPATYLDKDIVVFRDKDGKARISDAYCPHLGAHLASHDGRNDNGTLICPFHKWAFDGATGRCKSIPYTQVTPPVGLTMHPVREINDTILMWYSPSGAEPDFEPFDMAVFDSSVEWLKVVEKEFESTAPYRDLFENLFDTAHVQQLHNSLMQPDIATIDRTDYGMRVVFVPPGEGEAVQMKHLENNFIGTTMCARLIDGGSFAMKSLTSATPIDHERFKFKTRMYLRDMGSAEMNDSVGKMFAERVSMEIDQDFKVLNFKRRLDRPALCAGDGPILKFRAFQNEYYA
jgi:3-ketosteroid 9alpha-monooxygenase subunit A